MSGYIGTQPVPQATQTRDAFTATNNQTSFPTSGYTPEFLDVFLNGVKLAAADYTATNGSDVVLAAGATTGDILEVVSYGTFEVLNPTFDGNVTFTGNASFGDNDKAIFGDGSDLQIYSDGTHGIIKESGSGDLLIYGNNLRLGNADGSELYILGNNNAEVQLRYNNATKLATTSTGIDVTGTVVADGLTIGSSSISAGTGLFQQIQTAGNNMYVGVGSNNSAYVQANGEFRIATGGYADKVTVTTSGNVGIGTSSPASDGKLTIHGTDTDSGILLSRSSGNDVAIHNIGGTLAFRTGGQSTTLGGLTDHMRLDASGNLLVGTNDTTLYNNTTGTGTKIGGDGRLDVARQADTVATFNRTGSSDGEVVRVVASGTTVGSTGVVGGNDLYIAGGATGIRFDSDVAKIYPTNGTGAVSNGAVDIGEANFRFKDAYLSGGIYLGGTVAANKLDDYEEGTWTPTIVGGGTPGTYEASVSYGTYTKIGRQVNVQFVVTAAASLTGGGTSYLRLIGLPFNYIAGEKEMSCAIRSTISFTGDYLMAAHDASTANYSIAFYSYSSSGVQTLEYLSRWGVNKTLKGNITYFTDA
jgi:hypothetical protein